jgi:DNA ligase-1
MNFAELYRRLDESNKTSEKLSTLVDYFGRASDRDASWAVFFLTGRRLPQPAPNKILRNWAANEAKIPDWLFEETYAWVGDLAETMSCVLPASTSNEEFSLSDWVDRIGNLRSQDEYHQRATLTDLFAQTAECDRFPMMKLLTGAMRVGVSQGLVVRALSRVSGLSHETIAHRLMGDWEPSAEAYSRLMDPDTADADQSRPYPFALANAVDEDISDLGDVDSFLAEWKWDGIRAQLIRRRGATYLWSRGEERLDGKYPEIETTATDLPRDCVLDGEILGWKEDLPLPFADLQRRIGRKTVGKKLLQDVPIRFVAFDLLELDGIDWRNRPQRERRTKLEELLEGGKGCFRISEKVEASTWSELARIRESAREKKAEGLMLKQLDSTYQVGRVRGHWWKWKIDPYTIDAVLIYAQRGHGRRAALYTDFTFALWDNGSLVPFAKAYSGLTDQELKEVDRFVRDNTREKFGPVRSVTPQLVMELAFENIQLSNRHKSGVAVRFPRIVRWRHDKTIADADRLEDLKRRINQP